MFCATDELRWHVIMYCCIADDNLAPSTEYYEEIATVTQFLSEIQPSTNIAVFYLAAQAFKPAFVTSLS